MIKELCKDDELLSQRCRKATAADEALVQDLIDTLDSIEDGACLAANQIGEAVALCVYKTDDEVHHVMFNPRLVMGLAAQRVEEGCLCHEDTKKVTRYGKVKIAYDELKDGELVAKKGDFVGWEAQMIQHMCDHCQGKLV